MRPLATAALGLVGLTAFLGGCGGGSESTGSTVAESAGNRRPAPDAVRVPPLKARVVTVEHLRRAVLQGLGRDFLGGTQVGPPSYGLCLQRGVRRLLDERALRRLALVYRRPSGQQLTAQALTEMAAPVGRRCAGGRRLVPTLIEASIAFRAGHLPPGGMAARLSYGPYLGVSCRRPNAIGCDRVGIDLVLRRDAASVTAWVGGRKLRMRTPGLHTGNRGRDWVGYLDRVGLRREGSPFFVDPIGKTGSWAGYPPVFVPVRLRVVFPRGRWVRGPLPQVLLGPGWG